MFGSKRLVSFCVVLVVLATVPLQGIARVMLPDFTTLVESEGPAVVNISTTQASESGQFSLPGIDENDPMFEFFRRFVPRMPEFPGSGSDGDAMGSGFIVSSDGYILTNAHLVTEADEIIVRLADKREFTATVVGADVRSDVAVIRIEATDLPTLSIGDPDRLKVGEWVLAIGSPFGFEQSVTAGIVSAKGRSLPDENFVPFIQTDVAINPGNSGGPLFNMRGEVVGINSQIFSQTGGFMGLSFAIPIDVAMDVYRQLRASGRVQRGRIGVAIQEVTRALAESFGLPSPEGALVSAVEPDGPADRAGVTAGDVILSFDAKAVSSSNRLPAIVAERRPGAVVPMQIMRDGERLELRVTVGEWLDVPEKVLPAPPKVAAPDRLGLVLSAPSAAQLAERGVDHGLLIVRVSGPAASADLRPGDLVLAIVVSGRQTRMESVAAFEEIVTDLNDGQAVTLLIRRGETSSFVSLKAGG